jgi:hypothetical protein
LQLALANQRKKCGNCSAIAAAASRKNGKFHKCGFYVIAENAWNNFELFGARLPPNGLWLQQHQQQHKHWLAV